MSFQDTPPIVFPVTRIYWASIYNPREMFAGEQRREFADEVRYGFSVAMEELPEELRAFANPKQKEDGFYTRIESRYRIPIVGPGSPGTYLWDLGCMGYNLDVLLRDTPMEISAIGYEFDQPARQNRHYPPSERARYKIYPQAIRLTRNDVIEAEKRYVESLGFRDV